MVAHTSRSAVRVVEDLGYLPEVCGVIRVVRRVADRHRLAPTEQLELLPVALGEPHLELIALDEDHQVCVAVGSRVAARMRAEQDAPAHRGIRRKLIDETLDRLVHQANLPPTTPSGCFRFPARLTDRRD